MNTNTIISFETRKPLSHKKVLICIITRDINEDDIQDDFKEDTWRKKIHD